MLRNTHTQICTQLPNIKKNARFGSDSSCSKTKKRQTYYCTQELGLYQEVMLITICTSQLLISTLLDFFLSFFFRNRASCPQQPSGEVTCHHISYFAHACFTHAGSTNFHIQLCNMTAATTCVCNLHYALPFTAIRRQQKHKPLLISVQFQRMHSSTDGTL